MVDFSAAVGLVYQGRLEPDGEPLRRAQYQEHHHRLSERLVFHADFTATKTIDKMDHRPSSPTTPVKSATTNERLLRRRHQMSIAMDIWAVGSIGGLQFRIGDADGLGPRRGFIPRPREERPSQESTMKASLKGFTAFASLSYRLWAPDEPVAPTKAAGFLHRPISPDGVFPASSRCFRSCGPHHEGSHPPRTLYAAPPSRRSTAQKPSTTPKSQTRSISQSGGFRSSVGRLAVLRNDRRDQQKDTVLVVVCLQRSGRATRHDGRPLQVGAE